MGPTTEQVLSELSQIEIKQKGSVLEFKFGKLNLTKDLYWELIIDIIDDLDQVSMDYECVFLTSPYGYNRSLRGIINDFKATQKSMDTDESYIQRAQKIHHNYSNEAGLMKSIKFIAKVAKYESKKVTNQMKLYIPKEVAEFILTNINYMKDNEGLSKYALVLINKE